MRLASDYCFQLSTFCFRQWSRIMSDVVIQVDHLWKKYRLGVLGAGTLRHDFNRWLRRNRVYVNRMAGWRFRGCFGRAVIGG